MHDSRSLNGIGLQLHDELRIAGARCVLRTNSQRVISALASWRRETRDARDGEDCAAGDFEMNVLEDPALPSAARYEPRFRGLHHLVFADFGGTDTFVFDVASRRATAVVSSATAGNELAWNSVLLPLAVGVLGAALGSIPVHSACLDLDDMGVMLPGASGAGKSTMCAALARCGVAVVSDGWTYVTNTADGLRAHGISPRVKLLPDAVRHFPQLQLLAPAKTSNGEIAFDVDATSTFGARLRRQSVPRWLLFLQRTERSECEFAPFSA